METTLSPAFHPHNIPLVLSADNNYTPFLAVTLQSIITNSSPEHNYDIIVLSDNITSAAQNKLSLLTAKRPNFSLRFVEISSQLAKSDFFVDRYLSLSSYARLFIPTLLKKYEKAIYLDCDIIVTIDIAKLYHQELDNHLLLAVQDIWGHPARLKNHPFCGVPRQDYTKNILKIDNLLEYFNSGVLVLNIQKMNKINFEKKLSVALKEIPHPLCHDQDILNRIAYKDVKFLPLNWNFINCFTPESADFLTLPTNLQKEYLASELSPYIIHYAGNIKPWQSPSSPLAEFWWQAARNTPFYEEIIYKCTSQNIFTPLKDLLFYHHNLIAYYRHKLMCFFAFGRAKKRLKAQKKQLKTKVKSTRKLIKEREL